MANRIKFNFGVSLAILAFAGLSQAAQAQSAPAADAASEEVVSEDTAANEIVVTATAGGQGQNIRAAAFEITALDSDSLRQSGSVSSEALINQIPGVFAESSAGNSTGANIYVRGYAGASGARFATVQYLGTPLYPSSNVIFDQSTQHVRLLDPMIERVEGVLAGTGQLYGSGQIGLTLNVIPVTGTDEFKGLVGFGVTNYGEMRGEAMISGPVSDNVTFALGGFYHHGDSVRRAGYATERGGQISGNLKIKLDDGKLLLWGRHMDDTGSFVTDFPVNFASGKVAEVPGYPLGTYSPYSKANRYIVLPNGRELDLGQGRRTIVDSYGYQLDYDLSDNLRAFSKSAFFSGNIPSIQLFPFGAPTTVDGFASDLGLTGQSATVNGQAVAGTQPVILDTIWFTTGKLRSFTTENGVTVKVGSGGKLTLGSYYANYSANQTFNIFNQILLTGGTQPSPVKLTSDAGACTDGYGLVTQACGAWNLYRATNNDATDFALYANFDQQVTDALRVDAGLRWQHTSVTSNDTLFSVANEFNNVTPPFNLYGFKDSKVSFTAGASYEIGPRANLWARFSKGHYFPTFADIFNYVGNPPFKIVTASVSSLEGGVKTGGANNVALTLFYNKANNLNAVQVQAGGISSSTGSSRALGANLDAEVRPVDNLTLAAKVSYVDGKYTSGVNGATNLSGKKVEAQPKWNLRGDVVYNANLSDDLKVVFALGGQWVDKRFSDPTNAFTYPSYFTSNATITFDYADRFEFRISANNLNNSGGIGECTACGGAGFGRPLLGRSFNFDARVKF